jgi:hypothetical protein
VQTAFQNSAHLPISKELQPPQESTRFMLIFYPFHVKQMYLSPFKIPAFSLLVSPGYIQYGFHTVKREPFPRLYPQCFSNGMGNYNLIFGRNGDCCHKISIEKLFIIHIIIDAV